MLRHTVAQMLVEVAGVHVAQQVLGHRNISTTVEEYAHVDHEAMLSALAEVAQRQRRAQRSPCPAAPATSTCSCPGMLVVTALFGLETTTLATAVDSVRGVHDRLRSLPIPGVAIVAGRCLADLLASLVSLGFVAVAGPRPRLACVRRGRRCWCRAQ